MLVTCLLEFMFAVIGVQLFKVNVRHLLLDVLRGRREVEHHSDREEEVVCLAYPTPYTFSVSVYQPDMYW